MLVLELTRNLGSTKKKKKPVISIENIPPKQQEVGEKKRDFIVRI
jgi:hypothetical protein